MRFDYENRSDRPRLLRSFIKEQGISKKLLAKIKFQGGKIEVNGVEKNVREQIFPQEILTLTLPEEKEHETMLCEDFPIDIVFEDAHFLLINKPAGIASIPSQYHPTGTVANRVKHYLKQQNYKNQVIHVVTRLDRDTTGLMLFAKHGFAHAKMDVLLREKRMQKRYLALVSGEIATLKERGEIIAPIERDMTSLLKRKVGRQGKEAHTEYFLKKRNKEIALLSILLHTGRTHQIRVHFEHLNCPLLGDAMYGGRMDLGIKRQALHCFHLQFRHPFTGKEMDFEIEMPKDMHHVLR